MQESKMITAHTIYTVCCIMLEFFTNLTVSDFSMQLLLKQKRLIFLIWWIATHRILWL